MNRKEVILERLQNLYDEEHALSHELWQILWNEKNKKQIRAEAPQPN